MGGGGSDLPGAIFKGGFTDSEVLLGSAHLSAFRILTKKKKKRVGGGAHLAALVLDFDFTDSEVLFGRGHLPRARARILKKKKKVGEGAPRGRGLQERLPERGDPVRQRPPDRPSPPLFWRRSSGGGGGGLVRQRRVGADLAASVLEMGVTGSEVLFGSTHLSALRILTKKKTQNVCVGGIPRGRGLQGKLHEF